MGRKSSQRRNAAMLDTDDDDDSSVSSSSSVARSDLMSVSVTEEVQLGRDSVLEQALDALYEKRGSTREKALLAIIEAFNSDLQYQFVEQKFATLLHQCISCIKKGASREIALACHVIGLLALIVGHGDNAHEMLEESIIPITQALRTISDSLKTVALLECLAFVTFVGGSDAEDTERSMRIMWQVAHPKLGTNVVSVKPSAPVTAAMVSAWAFLLTTMDVSNLSSKDWQQSISYLSGLLDKDDRSIRIAAGEALAVIFEMGALEKFAAEAKSSAADSAEGPERPKESFSHIQGLKSKILNQVRSLSAEAGGKGSVKKDLNNQRNFFKDVLEFLEDGYCPETTTKIGGDSIQISAWYKLIQLNYFKHFLGGGFAKHIQDNEFLHEVLEFTPKRKLPSNDLSSDKRYRSPNSAYSKARTQFLNKQRLLSEGRNVGHFAVDAGDEEA